MALEEKISEHLGKPYVYLKDQRKFLCSNGVMFTLEEYKNGIDINKEYERREKEDELYDYDYAKNTGLLRKKRKTTRETDRNIPKDIRWKDDEIGLLSGSGLLESSSNKHTETTRRNRDGSDFDRQEEKQGLSVLFIVALLGFTSLISGYISTLHTATYLYDYVDVLSAWFMSASVTAYNATAFEVAVIFKKGKRYGLTFLFIVLWSMVTAFSMATTVSVFYDRFNFNEAQTAQENHKNDSNKLAIELLRTKEKDIRESIAFKKKDIEYRQEHEYATTAVRTELNKLQEELQNNLSEQQKLLSDTPDIAQEKVTRKESLFAFLGRMMHMEGGILEFIMSTLSAIFINLIAPMSLVAVTELVRKRIDNVI